MLESELVDGAEYEGNGTASGRPRRGKLSLAKTAENPFSTPSAALFGVKDGDISPGEPCYVRLDSLRRVAPAVEPAKVADGDRLFETGCCLCGQTAGLKARALGGGYTPENDGLRLCEYCFSLHWSGPNEGGGWRQNCDREVNRRRAALAASAQKLVSGSVGSMEVATREDANLMSWKYDRGLMSSIQRAEPERPTSDDLAWAIRRETLAAEEQKRWHMEERRKAYRAQRGDQLGMSGSPTPDQIAAFGRQMDAAIARVKPAERDEPVYVNLNWPEADPNDP